MHRHPPQESTRYQRMEVMNDIAQAKPSVRGGSKGRFLLVTAICLLGNSFLRAACVPPPNGLVGWWRGEGNFIDAQGQQPATFTAPRYAPGKVGQAFEFDGTNEIVIPDSADLNFSAFTAEAWVYPTVLDGDVEIIMNKEVDGYDTLAFEFGIKGPLVLAAIPTGNLAVFVGGVKGMPSDYSGWSDGGAPVPLNTWSHVVLIYGEGTAQVFLNGTLVRSFTGLTGTLRTTTGPLKIGSRSDSVLQALPNGQFNGRIDEPSLYNRALTAAEVDSLYQIGAGGKCVDPIANPPCATPPAGLLAWYRAEGDFADSQTKHASTAQNVEYAEGKVGQAFQFYGSNGITVAADPDLNRDTFTFEAWVSPNNLNREINIVLDKESGPQVNQIQFKLGVKGSIPGVASAIPRGNLAFYLGGVNGLPDEFDGWTDGKAQVPLNQWTHVVLTVSPASVVVFLNGLETRRFNGLTGAVRATDGPLMIGSSFDGRLDEVSIYSRTLEPAEVSRLFVAADSGKCADDIELQLTIPAKVPVNEVFLINARVINHGAQNATKVSLTNIVPVGVSVIAVTNAHGSVFNLAGFVIADLGTIAGGSESSVQLLCRALLPNTFQITAWIGRGEADLDEANNLQAGWVEAVPLALNFGDNLTVREASDSAARLTVSLSAPSAHEVRVDYRTINQTAIAGKDFRESTGTLIFPPGTDSSSVTVPLLNDFVFEESESFQLVLQNVVGAELIRSKAVVNIISDDPIPRLNVSDVRLNEENAGLTNAIFIVTVSGATERIISVNYATAPGTASAPTDFIPREGRLTFAPGVYRQTVEVPVRGDTIVEPSEYFFLELSLPTNAILSEASGIAVIQNDDFIPGQLASFVWGNVPTEQLLGEPFTTTLTAVDGSGLTVNDFSGAVALSAQRGNGQPSSVVISQIFEGTGDRVEFINASTNTIDVAGWKVTFYDGTSWPLPKGMVTVPNGIVLKPGSTFRIGESRQNIFEPDLLTGFPLDWGTELGPVPIPRPIAVLVQDDAGRVSDFFCAAGADPRQISIPLMISNSVWSGPGVRGYPGGPYQRRGSENNHSAKDWTIASASSGGNSRITLPFMDSTPLITTPRFVFNFTNGVWSGSIQVDDFAPRILLRADDGNGHFGISAPLVLRVEDDLAVTVELLTQPAALNSELRYFATVTNPGPNISSNVVLELRLDPFLGGSASVVSFSRVSQGTRQSVSYTGSPSPGRKVTARFGEIPAGGVATLEVFAKRLISIEPSLLPTNVVTIAVVTRTQPDIDSVNNTATRVDELSTTCVPLNTNAVAWWWADNNGQDGLGTHQATFEGAASFGAGRVGTGSFRFDNTNSPLVVPEAAELNFSAGSDFTVEAWIRIPLSTTAVSSTIVDKRAFPAGSSDDPVEGGVGYVFFVRDGFLGLHLADSLGRSFTGTGTRTNQFDLRDGNWHHVAAAVTRNGKGSLVLMVDGVVVRNYTQLSVQSELSNDAPFHIGNPADPAIAATFEGEIDELTLYRAALPAADLRAISRAGAFGKCASEVSALITSPTNNGVTANQPIFVGRPEIISMVVTNSSLLAVPTSWLLADLGPDTGSMRWLTPPLATNVFNEFTTYYNFGPIPARSAVTLQRKVTLTNVPPSGRAYFSLQIQSFRNRYVARDLILPIDPDFDNDDLPDMWELANGFDPTSAADSLLDVDGDGVDNLGEFISGTDPRSGSDVLNLQLLDVIDKNVRVRFPGASGRAYVLERRAQVDSGDWTAIGRTTRTETGTVELTVPTPLAGEAYYRLQVIR